MTTQQGPHWPGEGIARGSVCVRGRPLTVHSESIREGAEGRAGDNPRRVPARPRIPDHNRTIPASSIGGSKAHRGVTRVCKKNPTLAGTVGVSPCLCLVTRTRTHRQVHTPHPRVAGSRAAASRCWTPGHPWLAPHPRSLWPRPRMQDPAAATPLRQRTSRTRRLIQRV